MVAMKRRGAVVTAAAAAAASTASAAAAAAAAITTCVFINIRYIPPHAYQPYEHRSTTNLQLHPLDYRVPCENTPLSQRTHKHSIHDRRLHSPPDHQLVAVHRGVGCNEAL